MYHLTVENAAGEQLEITDNEEAFLLMSITGLNPVNASVATSSIHGMDGTMFNSSKLNERNIAFTVKLLGDIESNRQLMYRYVKSRGYLKLYIESNNRRVYIDGYVESIDCDIFTNFETIQVSVICPDPMFKDQRTTMVDATNIEGQFTFPFSIEVDQPVVFGTTSLDHVKLLENDGDESGMEIDIVATGTCLRPVIRNYSTGEEMIFNFGMCAGDKLRVNTNKGRKQVLFNEYTNGIKWLEFGSKWLSLRSGVNYISYGAESGEESLNVTFSFEKKYQGV